MPVLDHPRPPHPHPHPPSWLVLSALSAARSPHLAIDPHSGVINFTVTFIIDRSSHHQSPTATCAKSANEWLVTSATVIFWCPYLTSLSPPFFYTHTHLTTPPPSTLIWADRSHDDAMSSVYAVLIPDDPIVSSMREGSHPISL